MNFYIRPDQLKERLDEDYRVDALWSACASASREAEGVDYAGRIFWTGEGIRFVDNVFLRRELRIPDCIRVNDVHQYDPNSKQYVAIELSDLTIRPTEAFPKTSLCFSPGSGRLFSCGEGMYKVEGVFGYGNGTAWPWGDSGITGSIASSGSELTLSKSGVIFPGHTLLLDDEQVFVSATGTGSATVVRGVNSTTPAAHSNVNIEIAEYPADLVQGCLALAVDNLRMIRTAGISSVQAGDFREQYKGLSDAQRQRLFARLRG